MSNSGVLSLFVAGEFVSVRFVIVTTGAAVDTVGNLTSLSVALE